MIRETKFENGKVVTCDLSKELHDIAAEMVIDDPFWLMEYNFKEADKELCNVWIADAFSEGREEYANFLQKAIADGADIYTMTQGFDGAKQELGEIAVYIYD